MIFGRGIVGISDRGIVFSEKPIARSRARKAALEAVGSFVDVVPVGKIYALFADNPVYPSGCSPSYGFGQYETCHHCVLDGDLCRTKNVVNMSDGSRAGVVGVFRFNACRSLACWLFARFFNRRGWVLDRCIEEFDNAFIDKGNEGEFPDLILFAGSEDERLALFVRGAKKFGGKMLSVPFRVRVQSVDYWAGDRPKVVEWETVVNDSGTFLVWFGPKYVLPFRAYLSYPSGVGVKPGFSGSNAYVVG